MPFYDYRCEECDTVFEQRRSMADADKAAVCPTCDSLLTTRLLSRVTLVGAERSCKSPNPNATRKSHGVGCRCCTPVSSRRVKKQKTTNQRA